MINVVISGGETLPVPKGLKMRLLEQLRDTRKPTLAEGREALHRSPLQLVLPDLPNPDIPSKRISHEVARDGTRFASIRVRE